MEFMTGNTLTSDMDIYQLMSVADGEKVTTHGMVYSKKDMSDFAFITLRKNNAIVQCILEKNVFNSAEITPECSVNIEGIVKKDDRAPNGLEIQITNLTILSKPHTPPAINLSKRKLGMNLETKINMRPITMRNVQERAVFKFQEGVVKGFRDYFSKEGYTEVSSPKIVANGAEGGANIFKLDYFGKKAFLAQSPQFYKQTLVGVFEKVFEIGPVFRAEKHNTTRHLNEYIGIDMEIGFINSFYDVMEAETGAIQSMLKTLETEYARELKILNVTLPNAEKIPCVKFEDAKKMVSEAYDRKIKDPFDLEPEEEQLISKLFKEKYDADFVFVTHYPSKKRPFYAIDDPEDSKYTLSFDLLFKGMEITTGGQRIHDYDMQVEKMVAKGLNPEDFESYIMIHKHGMPPHGGLGMGLERLCMKLLDGVNVREASMFPRDMTRLVP